jgi:hypothetical protein
MSGSCCANCSNGKPQINPKWDRRDDKGRVYHQTKWVCEYWKVIKKKIN